MNTERYQEALKAYKVQNFEEAAQLFSGVALEGEPCGEAYHLQGNCYMRLRNYQAAREAYQRARADVSYPKQGALAANQGRAELALGLNQEAQESFNAALADPNYETRYKAFMNLARVHEKNGEIREAGAAYRNAALDPKNPDASQALLSLGSCFMQLKRPGDAVEAYRAALDVSPSAMERNIIFAQLGQAYVAVNRMDEALSSFSQACADGSYELSPAAQEDSLRAQQALQARKQFVSGTLASTDEMVGGEFARTARHDALQQSGAIMPSPEDTGFFEITEHDLVRLSKQQKKAERKHKHTGLKFLIVILILLICTALGLGFAYYKGFGFPTQQAVIKDFFERVNTDKDTSDLWVSGSEELAIKQRVLEVGKTSSVELQGLDKDMQNSRARVKVELLGQDQAQKSQAYYLVNLRRAGLGWKLADVHLIFDSLPEASQSEAKSTAAPDLKESRPNTAPGLPSESEVVVPGSELQDPASDAFQEQPAEGDAPASETQQ